jgi:hypothetical protein
MRRGVKDGMHRVLATAGAATLILLLAACSEPSASPSASPSAAPTAAPSAPPNMNLAVVRIEQTGGMMPPWETLRWYPMVAFYADGRLITQGPQVELYPGPALPNLQVTRFSQDAINQVLQWAAQAGLQGPDRQLGPMILDAGSTLFTVPSPAGTHHTSVTDLSANDPEIGALREFMDVMTGLRQWLADYVASDDMPYLFERLRVISFPADPANLPDPNFAQTVEWPLSSPASRGQSWGEPADYRCWELATDELETVRPLFAQANELTLYLADDDVAYQFYLHPLLPDDEACPGF